MADHERQLHDALCEVMDWIDNWGPSFTEDPEWSETEKKALNALIDYRHDRSQRA